MTMIDNEVKKIEPNQEIEFINSPFDADTVFCDGFRGLAMQPHITKVSFFEQILDVQSGAIQGKYILNLAIPNDQFIAIANILKQAADDLEKLAKSN